MTVAAVTHFCGDPFTTLFWLYMYKKYWRNEVDKLYAYICFNEDILPPEMIDLQREAFAMLPEVILRESEQSLVPERTNAELLRLVGEDITFLIETDAFLFRENYLTQTLIAPIASGQKDIVAAEYRLFPPEVSPMAPISGLMRNIMSCKTELLHKTDLNFFPRVIKQDEVTNGFSATSNTDCDCFGWMSYQLLTQKPRIQWLSHSNMINSPGDIHTLTNFSTCPFVHVRQFNSSFLGMGQPIWKAIKNDDTKYLENLKAATPPGTTNTWYFEKGIAFRWIFTGFLMQREPRITEFGLFYLKVLDKVIDLISADRAKISHYMNMFAGLLKP